MADKTDKDSAPAAAAAAAPKPTAHRLPSAGQPMYTAEEQKYVDEVERDMSRFMNRRSRALEPLKENPLVPLGALATAGVLAAGLYQFTQGSAQRSQLFMRARVVVQGFTVISAFGGVVYMKYKQDQATNPK